jgi:hypothetical protein
MCGRITSSGIKRNVCNDIDWNIPIKGQVPVVGSSEHSNEHWSLKKDGELLIWHRKARTTSVHRISQPVTKLDFHKFSGETVSQTVGLANLCF